MAITSNIDIAVEEAQFAAFYAQFKKYSAELDKTPEAWRKVSRSAEVAKSKFAAVSDAAAAHAKTLDQAVESTITFRRVTDATALAWKTISRDTATAAYHINNATMSLLKWAGVTSIVSGVLGLGGLTAFGVGIDLLGASVASQRTTSMGLGTSIGGLQSARTNFGRFGNVESMLERMQRAKTDVNFRIGLRNLGFTDEEINNSSSDELLSKALPRVRKFAQENQRGGMLANALESKAIPFDLSEAQTLAGAQPGEVEGLSQEFFKNKKEFEPAKGVAEKWQDFTTKLEKAGRTINRVISDNLVNIEPGLNSLSDALSDLAKHILERDGPVAHWLEDLGHGIEWLAKKMEEPEFVQSMDGFVKWIGALASKTGQLAEGIVSWARWLGLAPAEDIHAGGSTGPGYAGANSGTRTPPSPEAAAITGTPHDRGGSPDRAGGGGTGSGLRGGGEQDGGGSAGSGLRSPATGGVSSATGGGSHRFSPGLVPDISSEPAEKWKPSLEGKPSPNLSPVPASEAGGQSDGKIGTYIPSQSDTRADRNFNPGNIGYGPWARAHGATGAAGTDTGHGVAVFRTPQAGFDAMRNLAAQKYNSGKTTADELIAGSGGWTPGNREAAANVARSMGLRPNEDLQLNDPARMRRFQDALSLQEGAPRLRRAFRGAPREEEQPKHKFDHSFLHRPHINRSHNTDPSPLPEGTVPLPPARPKQRAQNTSFRNPMRDMSNHPRLGANRTQVVINRNVGGNPVNTVNQLVRM